MPIDFPQSRLALIQELASRVLETRAVGCDGETLARDLLAGFHDVCMRSGLDRVLGDLAQAFPPLDVTDRFGLADHARFGPALIEKLGHKPDFDDGGPRNAKPRQLAECVVASLTLGLVDEPERTISLSDAVRAEVTAALATVVDIEFAVPKLRDTVIAKGRELCEPRYHGGFDKIAAQLDDRGMRMLRQPKVSLDAVQAVQAVLAQARDVIVARIANVAIDRAKQVLSKTNTDAAARIDLPITHRLTPRDVAIRRACESRVPKVQAAMVLSLLDSLTELAQLTWLPPEQPVRTYGASQTFVVGDLLEHPKFGRGSVVSCAAQRIEVEFADGKHTLVHVGPASKGQPPSRAR